jgi:predicted nucleic acid-binding protein
MSVRPFLDSNILVYATARDDWRHDQAIALLRAGGTISVQVLNEFASVARRKLGRRWPDIAETLADFRVLCPEPRPIGVATHEAALTIAARDGFAFYDGLIVASALEAGCDTLFSDDMQDGRVVAGSLTIRNPFAGIAASG